MKSPFPGMDPYLEQHWPSIHARLIAYSADTIQALLPDDLRATIEERIFVETEEGRYQVYIPDVHVIEQPKAWPPGPAPGGGVAVEKPLVIYLSDEPVTQGYIEIVDVASGNRVVSVIEYISPSNKMPGEGRDLYLRKQEATRRAGANLVEIDLTRSGRRTMVPASDQIPSEYRTTYQVCVTRAGKPPRVELYRAPLNQRLPSISIPLRPADSDLPLDLQSLVDQCYDRGRYDPDYHAEPVPPLAAADAVWADQLLRAKGLR